MAKIYQPRILKYQFLVISTFMLTACLMLSPGKGMFGIFGGLQSAKADVHTAVFNGCMMIISPAREHELILQGSCYVIASDTINAATMLDTNNVQHTIEAQTTNGNTIIVTYAVGDTGSRVNPLQHGYVDLNTVGVFCMGGSLMSNDGSQPTVVKICYDLDERKE